MLAATRPASQVNGWMVNVGAGMRTSLLELVRLVGEVTGREVALDHRPPRGGDVRDSLASLERAREVLGYEPTVPLPRRDRQAVGVAPRASRGDAGASGVGDEVIVEQGVGASSPLRSPVRRGGRER